MGLNIEVGILADLLENDVEGAEYFRAQFKVINRYLRSVGLQPHQEPDKCRCLSYDMWGYSGLHHLRRVAACLELRGHLPTTGSEHPADDPVLLEFYERHESRPSSIRDFAHLIVHSDAEGYYLPQDFPDVLVAPTKLKIAGQLIGSSTRLLGECDRLAAALALPLDLNPEAEEVYEAADSDGKGECLWKRFGIASFVCLRLHRAAQHSLRTGAAIQFC